MLVELLREPSRIGAYPVSAIIVVALHALPYGDQVLHVVVVAALGFYGFGDGPYGGPCQGSRLARLSYGPLDEWPASIPITNGSGEGVWFRG